MQSKKENRWQLKLSQNYGIPKSRDSQALLHNQYWSISTKSMSKLIQSAYTSIESGKFKKALTILDSPELDRFPTAKVYIYDLIHVYFVGIEGLLCGQVGT